MSRSGYDDSYGCGDQWALIRWRGAVESAIRGKRGQAFMRELLAALDAMPEKRLISNELRKGGEVCALGSVGAARGVDLESLDPDDYDRLSGVFNIAAPLVQEVEYMNDEVHWCTTPEQRWAFMRAWTASQLKAPTAEQQP